MISIIVAWKEFGVQLKKEKKNLLPFYIWTCEQWCNFLKCLPDAEGTVGGKILLCMDILNC